MIKNHRYRYLVSEAKVSVNDTDSIAHLCHTGNRTSAEPQIGLASSPILETEVSMNKRRASNRVSLSHTGNRTSTEPQIGLASPPILEIVQAQSHKSGLPILKLEQGLHKSGLPIPTLEQGLHKSGPPILKNKQGLHLTPQKVRSKSKSDVSSKDLKRDV